MKPNMYTTLHVVYILKFNILEFNIQFLSQLIVSHIFLELIHRERSPFTDGDLWEGEAGLV